MLLCFCEGREKKLKFDVVYLLFYGVFFMQVFLVLWVMFPGRYILFIL